MDARTALKNYTTTMVNTYGPDYWEHWTEDDRETFNILASRARRFNDNRQRAINPDTPFLRLMMGNKRDPEYATEQQKIKAWKALTARAGSGVVGKLREERLYDGVQPKRRRVKGAKVEAAPAAPKFNPDDVDSNSIFAYLMGNTN